MAATENRRAGVRLRRRLGAAEVTCALACACPQRRTLRSAETLTCFRRDLAKLARRAGGLSSVCGWIARPPRVPKLFIGPLEGACLASLVGTHEPEQKAAVPTETLVRRPPYPEPVAPEHLRPPPSGAARSKPSCVPAPEAWAARRRDPDAPPEAQVRTPVACELAPRAALPLLERHHGASPNARARLTGTADAKASASVRSPTRDAASGGFPEGSRPTFVPLARPPAATAASSGGSGRSAKPSALPAAASRRDVARVLTARLAHGVLRPAPALPSLPIGTHTANGFAPLGRDAASAWALASFASTPAGPIAPLELLLRVLRGETAAAVSSRANSSSAESSGAAPAPFLSEWVERSGQRLEGARRPIETTPTPEAPAPSGEAAEGARQGYYPGSGAIDLPAAGPGGGRPLVAPPLAADASPTLSAARFPFDAPTPIASGTLRREAKRDEATLIDGELDELAAKLQRILEEQARRHGIGA